MNAASINLGQDEAAERSHLIAVTNYDVLIDLSQFLHEPIFQSHTTIRFTCAEPGASSWIDLLAAEVAEIELNGESVDPDRVVREARVLLVGLRTENTLTVTARHEAGAGRGLSRSVDASDGAAYAWTQFEPYDARRAFACFDQPDMKAPFRISARAPRAWSCVSNGDTSAIIEEGPTRLWSFAETPPLPTYITALCAGPFHTVTDAGEVPVRLHSRRPLGAVLDRDAEELISLTRAGLEHFSRHFGTPYAGDSYDCVFLPDQPGAMENYGCVTWNDAALPRSAPTGAERARRRFVLLHEMAHMWFGNLVSLTWWDGLWLKESFADWAGFWASAAIDSEDRSWTQFLLTHKIRGYAADQSPTTHPISRDVSDVESAEASFDMVTYAKGAGVLRQLAARMGEDVFLAGLRNYFARYAWNNADLEGLLAELSATAGDSLAEWSNLWLHHAGVNTLGLDASVASGQYRGVVIRQSGSVPRPHHILVGCYQNGPDGRLTLRDTMKVAIEGTASSVQELDGVRQCVLLPNDGDLTFAKTRFDHGSLPDIIDYAHTLPRTLSRAVAVVALRDMVLDGELSARTLTEVVGRCLQVEPDSTIMEQLFAIGVEAATVYTATSQRSAVSALLASTALARRDASRDPDHRRVLDRGLAASATTPGQVAELERLLAEPTSDQSVRWACLTRLAALDQVDDKTIATEATRDRDPDAALHAEAARAARPTQGAKDAAFTPLLKPGRLPAAARDRLAQAFWQPGQDELLRPYANEYLKRLPTLARASNRALQSGLVRRTFPLFGVDDAFVADVKAIAESLDIPAKEYNAIRDRAHELSVALRARAINDRN